MRASLASRTAFWHARSLKAKRRRNCANAWVAVDKFWVKRCLGEKEGQNNEEKNRMLVIKYNVVIVKEREK